MKVSTLGILIPLVQAAVASKLSDAEAQAMLSRYKQTLKTTPQVSGGSPPPINFPSIDKFVSGVDAIYFSLYNPTVAMRDQIFELEYSSNKTTPDNIYLIPDGVYASKMTSCSTEARASTYSGGESYMSDVKVDVKLEGSGTYEEMMKGSLQGTVEYQQVKNGTSSRSSVFTSTSMTCQLYTFHVQGEAPPPFSRGFLNILKNVALANSSGELATEALKVVQNFGTHYVRQAGMGGKYMRTYRSSFEDVAALQSSSVSVEAGAKMSTLADIASLEASAAIGVDHKAANFFNKQSTSEETRTLGTLLIDGNTTQEIKDNWIKALFQDGSMEMVTAIQLTQIDSLFNSDFLSAINTQLGPTVPDITGDRMNEMKRQVTQALLGYCKNAVYAGTSEPIGCHDPSKDIPIPQPGPATLDWYMSGLHANCPVGATCERFNSTQEELVGSLDAKPYLHSTAYISKIELVLGDYAQYLVWAGIRATISDTIEGGTYAQPAVGVAPTKENKVVVVNIEASNPITEIEMSLGARVDSIFIVHFKDGTSQDYSVYPSAGPGGSGGKRMRSAENPTLGGKRIQFAFPPGEPLVGFSGFSCIDTSETLTNLFPIKRLSS